MAFISAIIPQRNAGSMIAHQLSLVSCVLERLTPDYELIVVDDASDAGSFRRLSDLLVGDPKMRLFRCVPACGLSAALSAGLAAARGDHVVTLPAGAPGAADAIEALLDELVRVDLVVGRPQRRGLGKALHRIARIPRWLVLGLEVRDPECLLWAARREAVAGLQLPRGMYRYLATLVAARGYRVGEISISFRARSVGLSDGPSNPGDLLAAWWLRRRWRQYERVEVLDRGSSVTGNLRHDARCSLSVNQSRGPAIRRRSA